jgi:hypothetical protein
MKPTLSQTLLKRLASKSPVSRFTLRSYLNTQGFIISDREMRREIVKLRDTGGHLITSSFKGYKLATTRKEFEAHMKYKRAYAMAILKECRLMKRNFNRSIKFNLY